MLEQFSHTAGPAPVKNDLIGSVQRALRILELLALKPDGLNAKQISLRLQLNLSTCYHLVNTLEATGYVVKDPDTLRFRLSGKIGYTAHGQVSPAQLVQHLTPHVRALQEATHETAYLSVWDGAEIILSAIVESPLSVRVKTLTVGYSEANHAMALGKAILAYLERPELDRYLAAHHLPAYTPNTLTDVPTLKAHLAQIYRQGYSLDEEEFLPDVYCIGAPVFDACRQIVASIAISLPGSRYHRQHGALLPKVKDAARAATRTMSILGYIRGGNSRAKADYGG